MEAMSWISCCASCLVAMQVPEDRPAMALPLPKPNKASIDHSKALGIYIRGLQAQHDGNLVEAVNLLEEVRRLDPEAVPPRQSLMPLYLGLLRIPEALESGERIMAICPAEFAC